MKVDLEPSKKHPLESCLDDAYDFLWLSFHEDGHDVQILHVNGDGDARFPQHGVRDELQQYDPGNVYLE